MLDFLRTEFLQPAEEALLKGDYGTAMYKAIIANDVAIRIFRDGEAGIISHDLASLVSRLIDADFEAIAEQRGLTITPENRAALLQEHSPHYVRFRELMTQPIPEVLLRNYYTRNLSNIVKNKNKLSKDLYKIIKTYELKNFKRK